MPSHTLLREYYVVRHQAGSDNDEARADRVGALALAARFARARRAAVLLFARDRTAHTPGVALASPQAVASAMTPQSG